MKSKILVTGSSGTIGTGLVKQLLKENYSVIPLDIKPSLWDKKIDRKTVCHDLRKPLSKSVIKSKPDIIVHLAANARVHDLVVNPSMALDNYVMTHNVLEYARLNGIKKVIYASSREIYGESKANRKRKEIDSHVQNIKSPYTASKYGGEAMVHAYHECYDIKPVIVRFSNVYGKYDVSERVVPLFLYYALRNRDMNIFGKEKKLDFTYIDDAVDGVCRIIKRFNKAQDHTFNISKGKSEPLYNVAKFAIKYLDSESKIYFDSIRVGEISSYTGDISQASKILNYKPKVSLEAGMKLSIEWYRGVMKERRIYDTQRRNLMKRGWA